MTEIDKIRISRKFKTPYGQQITQKFFFDINNTAIFCMDYDYENNVLKVFRLKHQPYVPNYKAQSVAILFSKKELDPKGHVGDRIIMTSANSLLVVLDIYTIYYVHSSNDFVIAKKELEKPDSSLTKREH